MKYEFIKKDADTTVLKYKDKSFEFKRDINLQKMVQEVHSKARTKMYIELTKQGIKKDDLVITEVKDGKTYVDNSNLKEVENYYTELQTLELMDDICNRYTNMNFTELVVDIGLDEKNYNEIENFTTGISLAIKGSDNTPSTKD